MVKKLTNIPELRFPQFNDEWIQKKYNEIFSFRTTNSYSREALNYYVGTVKNIHYGDIHTKFNTIFDITKEVVPFINPELIFKNISDDNYCKEGDLIIADASEDYADIGKCIEIVNLNKEIVLSGLHTILARPEFYKMAIGFNGHLMKSENIRLQIKTIAQGTKILSISSNRLAEIKLSIPSVPEQQKIASFLTSVDERIHQLTRKKNLLEQYKKGVMQKIFSQEIRFKDDKGKDFPEWEIMKIGEVTVLFSRRNKDLVQAEVYSVTNTNGFVLQADHFEREVAGDDLTNYKIIKKNEFAYNPARVNVGSIAHFKNEIGVISSLYVCFRTTNELSDDFLSYTLQLDSTKQKINIYGEGGVRIYLWYPLFASIKIQVPSLPEQNKIVSFLLSIDRKIELVNTQLEKTKAWKKGLLQKMFV